MPQLPLSSVLSVPMPVVDPAGRRLLTPCLQLRCLVRLPNTLLPRDGIIDTGSPFTWFPEAVWNRFRPGIDFEELPFETGFTPPQMQAAGWAFTFRMARMLQPLVIFDFSTRTELIRDGVIVQFADGNPSGSRRLPLVVLGLWGGILEGTSLRMTPDAATGLTRGTLEW